MTTDRRLNVLIAEDDAMVACLARAELESAGFAVAGAAADGREAVHLTQRLRPDVVLMDIGMPEMDGIAAAAEIQRVCPTPVVILTALDEMEVVRRASGAGIGAFVLKPADGREIERAIHVAVARHSDLMELRRLNQELQSKANEVRALQGLLPICCSCKKVRSDEGYWSEVETYLMANTDLTFTHGYCPDCLNKYFPEYGLPTEN